VLGVNGGCCGGGAVDVTRVSRAARTAAFAVSFGARGTLRGYTSEYDKQPRSRSTIQGSVRSMRLVESRR